MLHSSLWNLTFLLLLSSSNLLISLVISFSITVFSTQVFRRLSTSSKTESKLSYNEVGSTGSQYSSTPLQYGKVIPSSYYITHDDTDTYKAFIFPVFQPHLPLSLIFPCLLYSSDFPPSLCPLSCLTLYFWRVACLKINEGPVFYVVGLPYSSVLRFYPCFPSPPCYFASLGLLMVIKLVLPLMFWVIPLIFVVP